VSDRLDSWKGIAAYLGRDVRTLQRWALTRGLPVHRLPGGGVKPRVFALESELDAWMRAGTRRPPDRPVSIAVLPFANLAGDAGGQRFGDGLAEDLIDALVRVPHLRVTARTSSFAFSRRGQDVREIGARLGAAWLVEGSVRRDGPRVRVSAQLVDAKSGFHAWSRSYDRQVTDAFAIQDEIARSIALALELELAQEAPARRPTGDIAAYDLWLKGRTTSQEYSLQAFADGRRCYEEAIERDPQFARPHFGLAELLFHAIELGLTTTREDVERARGAMARALELDDRSADAHALSGVFRGLFDYDWPGAEAEFRRALELSPGSANILMQHAWLHLVPRRLISQALDEAEQAAALDPFSPLVLGRFGLVLLAARQYPRAVEECGAAVRLAPGLWWLRWFYGAALIMQGRVAQGLKEAEKVYARIRRPMVIGAMALVCGLSPRTRPRARELLRELEEAVGTAYVPPLAFAYAYIGAGDDRCFEWLGKAIDARDPAVTHLPSMPMYDGIRADPRFEALLARMNLG